MHGPLIDEFGLALSEMRVGEARQDALKKLSARVDSPELSAFVRAIIQADQLGISLGRILRVQAVDTRLKRQAAAEEKAMKAPIKMLFPTVDLHLPGDVHRHPRPRDDQPRQGLRLLMAGHDREGLRHRPPRAAREEAGRRRGGAGAGRSDRRRQRRAVGQRGDRSRHAPGGRASASSKPICEAVARAGAASCARR